MQKNNKLKEKLFHTVLCPFYYQQYWKAGLFISDCDYGKVAGYCSFSEDEANHFGCGCNLAHPNSFPRSAFLCRSPLYHSLHSPTFSASPIWHNQQLLLFTPFQVGTIPRSTESAKDGFHVLSVGSRQWWAVSMENSSQTFASSVFK